MGLFFRPPKIKLVDKIKLPFYYLLNKCNYSMHKRFPRASTIEVKKLFGDRKVNVIEIGTMAGENAESILKNLNVCNIFLIDPYENSKEYPNIKEVEKVAIKRLHLPKLYDRKIWIKGYSDEAVKLFPKVKLNFVYIDGSHEYKQVKKDMNNYWKIVKKGGIMAGHDIINHDGVSKAVIELCYKNKLNPRFRGEDWIIKK